jgi:starvation-inducible DNA-binding protein
MVMTTTRGRETRNQAKKLRETRNDLPESTRSEVAKLLNSRLADCVDLQTMCKQAHWNVRGPQFIALHKLFDDVYDAVVEYADLLAERVVQLGGVAAGTARAVAQRSTLTEYPLTLTSGSEHVSALSGALAQFGKKVRSGIEEVDDLDDAGSADILTEISRGTDKWLWFVEVHADIE